MDSTTTKSQRGRGVIERYRKFLPISAATPVVSLGEGNTPLIYCPRLSERVGHSCEVFVKNEGVNPTGSFKDRGMTVAVSKAIERGTKALICASTGNTSASAAAYAARTGISCVVILPAGKIATGKLLQAFAYGAKIVAIDGNFDDALRIVRELGETGDFAIVNSINPARIAGQKTAAFEIIDEMGDAPEFHLLPVGNAGNITAYWAGYSEFFAQEKSTKLPAMIGFPASWKKARAAIVESRGAIDLVSDDDILAAQTWLAQREGIFVEPASAASIAGLFKCCDSPDAAYSFQEIPEGSRIVCTVTGNGLKDPDVILQRMRELKPVAATISDVRAAIGL
jgi:threonine synthase